MRLFPCTFCFLVMLVTASAWAQDLCEPYTRPIQLSFDTKLTDAVYNHNLSIDGVRNLFTVRGQRLARSHANAIGLTYAELTLSISAGTRAIPRRRGGYCVYLEEVETEFGFDRMDVYIANDYPKGSCEYRTILDHENEHVAINKQVVLEFAPLVRAAVERELSLMDPIFAPTVNAGSRRAVNELQDRIGPALEDFRAEQRRRNAVIDTDESYGVLQTLCSDWGLYRNLN